MELHCSSKKITPYIINIKEMELTKFKLAKKRVLIYPFGFELEMNSFVAPADPSLGIIREDIGQPQLLDGREPPKKKVMKFV